MGDQRSGIAGVVASAGPLGLPDAHVEQVDLFGGDPAEGSPIEGTSRALGQLGAARISPGRRGRPAGSKNLMTDEVKRFLLANYRHPLLGLFDVAGTPPGDLAKLVAPPGSTVTREDLQFAWKLWQACTVEAADFVTPREPRALTITPGSAPLMSINLTTDQLTMAGVVADQAMQLGMSESSINSMMSEGIGGEVLDGEVLEQPISPEKSNG